MNPLKIFKYLEKKINKPIPLKVKLVNKLPLTKEELIVKGSLYLSNSKITSLPGNLKVQGSLDLSNTEITSLPDNLKVEGSLYLSNTEIISLPDNLKVKGSLYLHNTPLSRKYTKQQIRQMIEEKGGYVKGQIFS